MGAGSSALKKHYATAEKTGVLNISKSKLEQVPSDVFKLKNLRSLDVSHNKLSSLPPTIESFASLKTLILDFNQLAEIPREVGNLPKLENLSAEGNRIQRLPKTLSNLTSLKKVNLKQNRISEFPLMLCGIKHLEVLDLSCNNITSIPPGVSKLNVTELIVNQNQITSISEDLADAPKLKTFRIQENCLELSGFPPKILKDSKISTINVEGNLFEMRDFTHLDGYDKYMVRYTEVKKKLY